MGYYKPCNHNSAEAIEQVCAYCQKYGLRLTEIRRKVLQIIWASPKALTAYEIIALLGRKQPPLTYRALDFLVEQGFIHRIDSLNAYIGSHHFGIANAGQLLVCTHCHEVKEVSEDVSNFGKAAKEEDFHVAQVKVEVLGLCKDCFPTHT